MSSVLLKQTPQWDMTINHLTDFFVTDTKTSQDINQDHPDTRRHDDKKHKSRSLKNTVEIYDSSFSIFGEKFKQTIVLEKRAVARPKGARANEMRALVVQKVLCAGARTIRVTVRHQDLHNLRTFVPRIPLLERVVDVRVSFGVANNATLRTDFRQVLEFHSDVLRIVQYSFECSLCRGLHQLPRNSSRLNISWTWQARYDLLHRLVILCRRQSLDQIANDQPFTALYTRGTICNVDCQWITRHMFKICLRFVDVRVESKWILSLMFSRFEFPEMFRDSIKETNTEGDIQSILHDSQKDTSQLMMSRNLVFYLVFSLMTFWFVCGKKYISLVLRFALNSFCCTLMML